MLHFLWVKDIDQTHSEFQVLRFTRVVFGVSSSPFLLNATLKHHIESYRSSHPELVCQLLQSIYVDDMISGAQQEEDAYQLYLGSKEILKGGSFNLRKFVTNNPQLQQKINQNENSVSNTSVKLEEDTYAKTTLGRSQRMVLGLRWNPSTDQLIFCQSHC